MSATFKKIIEKRKLNANTNILVVHQDDVGVNQGANIAFKELCGKGFITSGSFMVNCPWYHEIAEICKANNNLDIGIHLTLTSEYNYYKWRPLSGANRSTGLVDEHGFFWSTASKVEQNASKDSVEKELRMQIETVLNDKIHVSHMDCHMGTALSPKFQDIYLELSKEYKIPAIFPRSWNNYNEVCSGNEVQNKGLEAMEEIDQYQYEQKVKDLEASEQFFIIDHFAMSPFAKKNENAPLIKKIITNLKPGITYLALHCNKSGEIEVIDPEQSHVRIEEYELAKNREFLDWIKTIDNLHLISMHDIDSIIF